MSILVFFRGVGMFFVFWLGGVVFFGVVFCVGF